MHLLYDIPSDLFLKIYEITHDILKDSKDSSIKHILIAASSIPNDVFPKICSLLYF